MIKKYYRFFDNSKYVEDFLNGRIRLSTLDHCRKLENSAARDENEGKLTISVLDYNHSYGEVNKTVAQNISPFFKIVENNIRIKNINLMYELKDAHVLCFSKEDSKYIKRVFGRHGLIVYDIHELKRRIESVLIRYDLFYDGDKLGDVIYNDQIHDVYTNNALNDLGFCKNKKFIRENEFRMLFLSKLPVKIEFIEIGNIRDIARKI